MYAHLSGAGDVSTAEVKGAGAAKAVQTGLTAEFRLTRIFSITAMGRVQPVESNVGFDATKMVDPFTTLQLNGQVAPRVRHPWQVVGGVAFLWDHFHLILGVGYGNYFAPGIDIAVPKRTIVPDGSLAVLF